MSKDAEIDLLKKALQREKKKVSHIEKLFEQKTYELYQSSELLKKQQETILRAEKLLSIGRLAAGIAHEINNPLTFVSSSPKSMRTKPTYLTRSCCSFPVIFENLSDL